MRLMSASIAATAVITCQRRSKIASLPGAKIVSKTPP